jgi:hypothetical protein
MLMEEWLKSTRRSFSVYSTLMNERRINITGQRENKIWLKSAINFHSYENKFHEMLLAA